MKVDESSGDSDSWNTVIEAVWKSQKLRRNHESNEEQRGKGMKGQNE